LIAPLLRFGCRSNERNKTIWKARFSYAQDLRFRVSPAAEEVPNRKALRPVSRSGGLAPTASGANSVASALGTTPGATPVWLCQHNIRVQTEPAKPERSTWLGTGTFYLALTVLIIARTLRWQPNRRPPPLVPAIRPFVGFRHELLSITGNLSNRRLL
jgi:hypothetical protein